jgi:hypothetical protein
MRAERKAKHKHILLTFDYELFLGQRSGTVGNCLLKPTEGLLDALKKYNAKAIFFIDTTYISRLREERERHIPTKNDFFQIMNQLLRISLEGHYLFHHIHPHWIDAVYNQRLKQWDLGNTQHFTLESLRSDQIQGLFQKSHEILGSLLQKAKMRQPSIGFRAGGLFVEPFDKIRDTFENHDIQYDFSVLSKKKSTQSIPDNDHPGFYPNKPYRFSGSPFIEEKNGEFIEFPITSLEIRGVQKLLNGLYYRFTKHKADNKIFGDGQPVSAAIRGDKKNKKLSDYYQVSMPLSLDMLNPVLMPLFKKTIRERDFIHFISHPKLMTRVGLRNFDKLLAHCNESYEVEYDFLNMLPE